MDVYEESEGLWNIRHSDYNNKIKSDSAMLKLMGEVLKRIVAVESLEVLRKMMKSSKKRTGKSFRRVKKKVEQELTMFINLNLHGLREPIFS